MFLRRFLLWTLWSITCSMTTSIPNMFELVTFNPGNIFGKYCYGNANHIPLCGWVITFMSSVPITVLTSYTATVTKINDHEFHITSPNYYGDLSSKQNDCENFDFEGPFGIDEPFIAMSFSCVCLSGSACQSVEYLTLEDLMPTQAPTTMMTTAITTTTTTTTTEPTTPTVRTTTQRPSPVTTSKGISLQNTDYSTIRLEKIENRCYIGSNRAPPVPVINSVVFCAVLCLKNENCSGLNFIHLHGISKRVCVPVTEGDWTSNLSHNSTCDFWRVVENSQTLLGFDNI